MIGLLKKKVFSLRLKVLVSVSSCSEDGRLFKALGPAHENERSPNFRRVLARSYPIYRWLLVDRRQGREVTSADAVMHSRSKDGARPMWTWCISTHNLNSIRCSMGNQCRSLRVAVTWWIKSKNITTNPRMKESTVLHTWWASITGVSLASVTSRFVTGNKVISCNTSTPCWVHWETNYR